MQTTSVQSGRLGESATSRTRVVTLVTFSRSTLTGDPEKSFTPPRKTDSKLFSCISAGSGRTATQGSHRPTRPASSPFGAGNWILEAGCYNTEVGWPSPRSMWGSPDWCSCLRRTLSVIPSLIHFSRILSARHAPWSKRSNRGLDSTLHNRVTIWKDPSLPFEDKMQRTGQQCRISSSHKGDWLHSISHSSTHSSTYGSILRIFGVRTGEAGKRQPDNFQGLKAGRSVKVSGFFCFYQMNCCRLKVRDPSGLTVEGLQEYYDEACLAILNNRWTYTEVTCHHTFINT